MIKHFYEPTPERYRLTKEEADKLARTYSESRFQNLKARSDT